MSRKGTFSKAVKHLKSTTIDEKIQMLNEIPTNSTIGYMTGTPSAKNPDFKGWDRGQDSALNTKEGDFTVGENPADSNEAKDTSGLFEADGTIRVAEPPGDTSYILGPMAAMYYTWSSPWTRIGYIRQADRKMVNLGTLYSTSLFSGKLHDWDGNEKDSNGNTQFSSYGDLTLAQAQWFRDIQKANGNTNNPDDYTYRAFYPGPPAATPDAWGRYPCVLTGAPKNVPLDGIGEPESLLGTGRGATPDESLAGLLDRLLGRERRRDGSIGMERSPWASRRSPWDILSGDTFGFGNTSLAKLGGSVFRSIMDPVTYAGDYMFKGMTSNAPRYNPAFTGSNPWGGKKIGDMLGGLFSRDVQYFTPDLNTAINYAGDGGRVVVTPRTSGVGGWKNWFGSNVSRGFDPTKGVEQIVRSSDLVAQDNLTRVINLSDEGSEATLKALARKGATNSKVLKTVGKAVPFLNAGLVATDVSTRIAKGDYAGALLGAIQIIPGPIGWIGLGSQLAYDVSGSRNNIPWNRPQKVTSYSPSTSSTTRTTSRGNVSSNFTGGLPARTLSQQQFNSSWNTNNRLSTSGSARRITQSASKRGFGIGASKGTSRTTTRATTRTPSRTATRTTSIRGTSSSGTITYRGVAPQGSPRSISINQQRPTGRYFGTVPGGRVIDNPSNMRISDVMRNQDGSVRSISDLMRNPDGSVRSISDLMGTVSSRNPDGSVRSISDIRQIETQQKMVNQMIGRSGTKAIQSLEKTLGTSTANKIASHVGKASLPGAEPITNDMASRTIQQLVTDKSEPQSSIASRVLNVATSVLPKNIKAPGKMFLGYLAGTVQGNAGDIIDPEDQLAAWKNLNVGNDGLSVSGHMANVFGGEPLNHLKLDNNGNAVLKFNFAPQTNEKEFAAHPGKYSPTKQKILNLLGPYSADLNIQVPLPVVGPQNPISGISGPVASLMTVLAKGIDKITPDDSILGGIKTGRDLNGDIKIPLEQLKDINKNAYNHLKLQQDDPEAFERITGIKTARKKFGESYIMESAEEGIDFNSADMGKALIDMGLPKEKKDFIREMGLHLMLSDNYNPEFLSMILMALDGQKLSNEQNEWIKNNLVGMMGAVINYDPAEVRELDPDDPLSTEEDPWGLGKDHIQQESRTRILKSLKEDIVIPEGKQKSYKVKPGQKYKNKYKAPVLAKKVEVPKEFKNSIGQPDAWGKAEYDQNVRSSQEKKNELMSRLYEGEYAFNYAVNGGSKMKSPEEMDSYWKEHPDLYSYYHSGKKYKLLRKEQVEKDYLVFLQDENGVKINMLQSELNEKIAQEEEKEALAQYMKENPNTEPISYDKDPMVTKTGPTVKNVARRLKNLVDYEGKPSPKGYPDKEVPKLVKGWHPEYAKNKSGYYKKLDPVSARAMPMQDDPEIDAEIVKARKKKKINVKSKEGQFSDWRKEEKKRLGSDLHEKMGTTSVFSIAYNAEGEDVDIETIDTSIGGSFSDPSEIGYESGLRNTSIVSSGTGSGENGGFNVGQDYLSFRGTHETDPRWAVLNPINCTYDQMVISAIRGNDTNGGEDPDEAGEELDVWYYDVLVADWRPLNQKPDGTTDSSVSKTIIPLGTSTSDVRDWTISLPDWVRGENMRFMLYQGTHSGTAFDHYGVLNVRYRRLTPISVVTPLDSPEAASFIRVGPISERRSSPKKRKKKVEDQLKGTKDYTDNKFGEEFPGSGTTLDSQEASPVGRDEVAQAHMDPVEEMNSKLDALYANVDDLDDDTLDAKFKEFWTDPNLTDTINQLVDSSDQDTKLEGLYYRLTQAYYKGDYNGELTAINDIIEINPDDQWNYYTRALINQELGNVIEIKGDLELMLERDENGIPKTDSDLFSYAAQDFPEILKTVMGDAYLAPVTKAWNEAPTMADLDSDALKKSISQALFEDPKNTLALWYRSHLNSIEGNLEGELADLEQIVKLNPNDADSELRLADVKLKLAEQKAAEKAAEAERLKKEAHELEKKAYKDYWEDPGWDLVEEVVPFEGDGVDALYKVMRDFSGIGQTNTPDLPDAKRKAVGYVNSLSLDRSMLSDHKTHPWGAKYPGFMSEQDWYDYHTIDSLDSWVERKQQEFLDGWSDGADALKYYTIRKQYNEIPKNWASYWNNRNEGGRYNPSHPDYFSDDPVEDWTKRLDSIGSIRDLSKPSYAYQVLAAEYAKAAASRLPDSYFEGVDAKANIPTQLLKLVDDKDNNLTDDQRRDIQKLANLPELKNADKFSTLVDPDADEDNYYAWGLPLLNYAVPIAKSNIINRPIVIDPSSIPQKNIDLMTVDLNKTIKVSKDGLYFDATTRIPVGSTPIPYADGNIRVNPENGKVEHNWKNPNLPADVIQMSYNLKSPDTTYQPMDQKNPNPIQGQGAAQYQFIVPEDGSSPYMLYLDHAYNNIQSTDPGEVAGSGPESKTFSGYYGDNKFTRWMDKNMQLNQWLANAVHSSGNLIHRRGEGPDAPNTGGMAGYPPNIRGDVITTLRIPLSKFNIDIQNMVLGKTKVEKPEVKKPEVEYDTEPTLTPLPSKSKEKEHKVNSERLSSYGADETTAATLAGSNKKKKRSTK